MAIVGMILVNDPGSAGDGPPQLVHAAWNGATAADTVFPGFLFVVGAALGLARPSPGRLVRRCLLLIVIGVVLNGVLGGWSDLRLPGVLQRIGLASLAAGLLRGRRWALPVLLAGWWVLLATHPLTPADNVVRVVDRAIFGAHHLYRAGPTDPEGLLSTLGAAATVLVGMEAATLLRTRPRWLAPAGALAVAVALLLDPVLPINKRLWTPSFVLWSGGIWLVVTGAVHLLVEGRRWQGWTWPLRVLGFNALLVYVLSELLGAWLEGIGWHERVYADVLVPAVGRWTGSVVWSALEVVACLAPAAVLWRRRISLRL